MIYLFSCMIVIILTHIKPLSWDIISLFFHKSSKRLLQQNTYSTACTAMGWGGVGDPVISRHGPRYTRRPCIKAAVPLRVYSQRANGLRDIPAKHLGRVEDPEVAALMTRRPRLAAFSAANLQSASCVSSLRPLSGSAIEMAHL